MSDKRSTPALHVFERLKGSRSRVPLVAEGAFFGDNQKALELAGNTCKRIAELRRACNDSLSWRT
jgi:hypothetical protein